LLNKLFDVLNRQQLKSINQSIKIGVRYNYDLVPTQNVIMIHAYAKHTESE